MATRYYYLPGVWYHRGDFWARDLVTTRRREAIRRARALARELVGVPLYRRWEQVHGPEPPTEVVEELIP